MKYIIIEIMLRPISSETMVASLYHHRNDNLDWLLIFSDKGSKGPIIIHYTYPKYNDPD